MTRRLPNAADSNGGPKTLETTALLNNGPGTLELPPRTTPLPAGLRSTVLGLGAFELEKSSQPGAGPGGTVALEPVPAPANPLLRTSLGIAPEANPNPAPDRNPDARPHIRTVLGVAIPGVAPLNPGIEKPPSEPAPEGPQTRDWPPPPPPPPRAPEADFDLPKRPGARTINLRAARKNSAIGTLAIGAAAALFAAAAVLFYVYALGPERIEARVILDAQGNERLSLRCPRCDDGTLVSLDGKQASFSGQKAELPLERRLNVGETPVTLAVRSPSSTQEHNVSLNVRIDYRVRADPSALSATVPAVRVLVDALPGSSVTVGDRPVALSADGRGQEDFDVSDALTGEETSVRRLERRIPYAVVPPGGSRRAGEVIVQVGITPLVVSAPGPSITVETPTFVLAGRTAKGSSVTVEGRPLAVDPEGRFAQVMNVSSVGATTVTLRSVAPNHAPRLFPLEVRRVRSFAEEASKLRAQVTTSYANIEGDLDRKRDWKVALDGSVLERNNLEHSTLFLFDVKSGCQRAPCLARVAYGARSELVPGDRIGVYGRVQGSVDGPRSDSKIPEISADFVLKANR